MPFIDSYLIKKSADVTLTVGQEQEVAPLELTQNSSAGDSSITGTVTSGGLAIADATVKVFDDTGTPVAHASTSALGEYTVIDLGAGDYDVTVIKNGYLLPVATPVTLADHAVTTVDLTINIDPNASLNKIYGIISDSSTTAGIENARVILTKLVVGVVTEVAETITNSDGEFIIYDLANGDYSIFATKQGYYSSDPADLSVTGGVLSVSDISLVGNPEDLKGTISGVVTDSATPTPAVLANALVGLYSVVAGAETLIATSVTNADGRYLFAGVDAGTYLVKAKVAANA